MRKRNAEKTLNGDDTLVIDEPGKNKNEQEEQSEIVRELLSGLEICDKKLEIFIAFMQGETGKSVGERYGISRSRVEQIVNKDVIPRIKKVHAKFIEEVKQKRARGQSGSIGRPCRFY